MYSTAQSRAWAKVYIDNDEGAVKKRNDLDKISNSPHKLTLRPGLDLARVHLQLKMEYGRDERLWQTPAEWKKVIDHFAL